MKTKLYLDTRLNKGAKPAPVKYVITKKKQVVYIGFDVSVLPEQWDPKTERVIKHPNRDAINNYISNRKMEIDNILFEFQKNGEIADMTPAQIKIKVLSALNPDKADKNLFASRFLKFANTKKSSTQEIYLHTYKRMQAYMGDKLDKLSFEDITKEWLTAFDTFLAKTSPSKNARNIHLRNIRSVFNEAIDDNITTFYPFRRFKIRPVATPKRSMTVEQLRTLFSYPVEPHVVQYLDMFKLIFFLCGINIIDLCMLKDIRDGRIEYYRAKTNRLYSIKVEPEAMEIINKYKGENYLLNIMDRYGNHKNYASRLNNNLKNIGEVKRVGLGGKKIYTPIFPFLSTYWARHSWATIAASLDIPKETIAAALGHGGNTVTDIYIDFDRRKIDEANRKVMDWVLYERR